MGVVFVLLTLIKHLRSSVKAMKPIYVPERKLKRKVFSISKSESGAGSAWFWSSAAG